MMFHPLNEGRRHSVDPPEAPPARRNARTPKPAQTPAALAVAADMPVLEALSSAVFADSGLDSALDPRRRPTSR